MPKKKKTPDSSGIVGMANIKPLTFITTGVKEIDELVGGYPRGRISMIYGLAAVGKTTLMMKCLAEISKNHKTLYCDVENALNIDRVKQFDADITNIDYTNFAVLEEVTELIRNSLSKYDCIILDSVAMLTPRTEHEGEIGQANVGLKPRLLGQWLRMITQDLADSNCALILVNQMRKNMTQYGDPYVLPGGMQLTFSSSLTLQLTTTSKDKIEDGSKRTGHWVHVLVKKSKVSMPHETTKFKLMYNLT